MSGDLPELRKTLSSNCCFSQCKTGSPLYLIAMPYFVYIMSNQNRNVFYVGVTNDIRARASEHALSIGGNFTSKYNCHDLLHYEEYDSILDAIDREKQLKKWDREWKLKLIRKHNPEMKDLSARWKGNP